jgi:hypothetical protein
MNIDYLYKTLEKSDVSLIGYSFKVEKIKDEFISKLPHINVGGINSSFSIKKFIRDYKISQVLDLDSSYKDFNWLVIDINDIGFSPNFSRYNFISDFLNRLRSELFELQATKGHLPKEDRIKLKLLITSPMYKSSEISPKDFNFSGALYISDFAFVIKEPSLSLSSSSIVIVKDRNGYLESNEISISELKNYHYDFSSEQKSQF